MGLHVADAKRGKKVSYDWFWFLLLTTSFPGSLILPPKASEEDERPWERSKNRSISTTTWYGRPPNPPNQNKNDGFVINI